MTSVEKPDHVDPVRMRRIPDADLLAAFGVSSLGELRSTLTKQDRARPVWDPARWALSDPASAPSVIKEGDALLTRQVDFLDRGLGRSRLYGFHYLGWLNPLMQAYALTGDATYVECFERLFGQWYDTRDQVVGDWPGLDVIWYSLGIASRSAVFVKALAVLGERMSERRFADLVKSIVGGARWAFEEHDSFRYGNWQLFSVAELFHVASMFPELDESAEWIALARQRLLDHLELDFYADGGHHERSPGYHTMCLEALHRVAVIGEQSLGWQLVKEERLRAMHDWLVALSTDAGWIPHLQDSGVVWPAKLLLRGEYFYPGRGYGALARKWLSAAEVAEELSWLPPAPTRDPQSKLEDPGSMLLPVSHYAILRGPGVQTVINYGPHIGHELESHSHHAALDFVIAADGVPLAWEAGCPPSYDDPGYYDWYQATRGHNTVQPPGVELSRERTVTLDTFVSLPPLDVFAAHHDGYPARHDRRVIFVRSEPSYWLVSDSLPGEGFVWRLHGTGLHVFAADPADPADVEHSSGPARIPDPVTRQAEYGILEGRTLRVTGARSDIVLAREHACVRRDRDGGGDAIVVRIGDVEDTFAGDTWTRTGATGLVATAAWDGDASSVSYMDGLKAVFEVARRTTVKLHAPGVTRVRLNGVGIDVRATGDVVAVEIPSAGRWVVEGEQWS